MSKLFRRISYLLNRRRIEADLAEEIETHRTMKQDDLVSRGMPLGEAKYASRRELGNVVLAREDARSIWIVRWLDDLIQDTMYALRSVRRAPALSSALILVTALGIGATNSVFGILDALVLKPLPVRTPDRLAYIGPPAFSYPLYSAIRERGTDIFEQLFAWNLESFHVDWNNEIEPSEVLTATGDFYSTLGVQPAAGRLFDRSDDVIGGGPNGKVAVISYAAWQRRFAGNPAAIGRTIRIQSQPFTIVGVAPRGFFGVAAGLAPEITIPLLAMRDRAALAQPSSAWLHVMGRLRDGVTGQQGDAALQRVRLDVLEVTTNPGAPADRRAKYLSRTLRLDSARTGFSRVRRQFEEPLWLLLALVALLFMVACVTAANLLLARGVGRQRELAIRLA